jgi:hypothetical protein
VGPAGPALAAGGGRRPGGPADDPSLEAQWHHEAIGSAVEETTGDTSVVIAVIDFAST